MIIQQKTSKVHEVKKKKRYNISHQEFDNVTIRKNAERIRKTNQDRPPPPPQGKKNRGEKEETKDRKKAQGSQGWTDERARNLQKREFEKWKECKRKVDRRRVGA